MFLKCFICILIMMRYFLKVIGMKKKVGIFALILFVFPLSLMASDAEWELDDSDLEDEPVVMRV